MKSIVKFLSLISAFFIFNTAFSGSHKTPLVQPTLLDPQVPILEVLPTSQEKILHAPGKSWYKSFMPHSWLNVTKYVVGGTVLSYGALFTYLLYTSYKINDAQSWASWHAHVSLIQMQAQEQITYQELLKAIGEKYVSDLPVRDFMHDAQAEISTLNYYLTLISWISYLKLESIFPSQNELKAQAQNKLDRLTYVHSLVSSFAQSK